MTLRRDFHRHPELSFEERRTAEIIAERLHAAKLEVRTGLGRTGVVGVLRGDRPGRTIAWRADIDALPLTEILDAPFTSSKPGVMHACGHDGHTAIAITLAEILAARRREMPGTAVFVFQPAEEVFGGAEPMIDAGVLEQPRVEEIYGLHLTTQTAVGQVGIVARAVDGVGGFLRRRGRRAGWSRCVSASVDRSDHRGGQHPARHAEPGLPRGGGATRRRCSPWGSSSAGRSTTSSRPRPCCVARCARSTRRCARQIKQRLADYTADMARAYRTNARLSFQGDGCPAVVNHERETAFVRSCATAELGAAALNDLRTTLRTVGPRLPS